MLCSFVEVTIEVLGDVRMTSLLVFSAIMLSFAIFDKVIQKKKKCDILSAFAVEKSPANKTEFVTDPHSDFPSLVANFTSGAEFDTAQLHLILAPNLQT